MTALMNLNRLAYFSAVAEAGSFTQAVQRLGITKAVVSQQVAKLEREVGATLFIRTTRSLRLTEAGRRLQSRCLMILQEAEFAYKELELSAAEPAGLRIRVNAMPTPKHWLDNRFSIRRFFGVVRCWFVWALWPFVAASSAAVFRAPALCGRD